MTCRSFSHGRRGTTEMQETSRTLWDVILVDDSSRLTCSWICDYKLLVKPERWSLRFSWPWTSLLKFCLGLRAGDLLRPDVLERLKELCLNFCRWSCLSFSTLLFSTTAAKTLLPVVQKGTRRYFSSCPCYSVLEGHGSKMTLQSQWLLDFYRSTASSHCRRRTQHSRWPLRI